MGIISFLKRMFSKDIMFKGDGKSQLVYVHKAKHGKIWLDKKINVPEKMQFYFAKNGTVLDGFLQGEYEISPIYIPKIVKNLKLDKKAKKGKKSAYFFAEGYYISFLQTEAKKWNFFTKAEFFDEKYGYFKAKLEGRYIAKITDAKKFLKTLLTVYDFLRQGEAEEILDSIISESVFKEIMKTDVNLTFLQDKEKLTDFLFEKLVKIIEKSGVELLGFSVEKVIFSKKFQKLLQNEDQEILQEKIKNLKENTQKLRSGLFKPFIKKSNLQSLKKLQKEARQKTQKKESSFLIKTSSFQNESIKIDKKIKNPYTSLIDEKSFLKQNESFIKCTICGENNSIKEKTCILCGETLKKGE